MKFIETIKVEDGLLKNLNHHKERAKAASLHFFGVEKEYEFEELIKRDELKRANGIYKLRVIYAKEIISFSFELYRPRKIETLMLIDGANIDYSYKYEDREEIMSLYEQRGDCDDILIIKDGYVTDTSYCNFIFSDGPNLFTPANPLLKGTKREQLLQEGILKERDIKVGELTEYYAFYIINAMFGPLPVKIKSF